MSVAEAAAKGEWLVDIGGGELRDTHGFRARRFEVAKEIILPPDRDRRPIAIGILVRLVDLILGHIRREVFRILLAPMRMAERAHLAGRLGALIDRRRQEFEVPKSIRADRVAGQRRIPSMLGRINGTPVLGDQVERAIQIPNDRAIRPVERSFEGNSHILPGLPIREVPVDIHVGILVVWKIIIQIGFPIDTLGARHPSGPLAADRSVVNPIHHVAALPGMVATEGFLQAARGIELIGPLRRLKRHIESFQLRFLGSEVVRWMLVCIQPENPIVSGSLGQQNRCVAQVRRGDFPNSLPVVPHRGLRHH